MATRLKRGNMLDSAPNFALSSLHQGLDLITSRGGHQGFNPTLLVCGPVCHFEIKLDLGIDSL